MTDGPTREQAKVITQAKGAAVVAMIHQGWPPAKAKDVVDMAYQAMMDVAGVIANIGATHQDSRVMLSAKVLAMQLVADRMMHGIAVAQAGAQMAGLTNEMLAMDDTIQ